MYKTDKYGEFGAETDCRRTFSCGPAFGESPPEIVKPRVSIKLLEKMQTQVEEEKQVIVHCCFQPDFMEGSLIRIWKSTYLIDEKLAHKSTLIHHENISLFPYWTEVPPFKDFWFTLVFSGLPRGCESFTLKEEIPEEDGFFVKDIKRNETDVYRIKIV